MEENRKEIVIYVLTACKERPELRELYVDTAGAKHSTIAAIN